ncbi:CRISPR-associated protein Cas5 [Campylobacter californiensis]|uniref:CRISPR-associated protein Cas5 n=1 Tax=Campylobacter californiensis TaxID=1032243 RepID=UPI00147323EB|nr:CRISPR-associated protein Cas5 [Campylobacter sp. RM12916]MBE3610457.1 CRISPR-associated protein Cas5 [Campylobacter sp. RM12916]
MNIVAFKLTGDYAHFSHPATIYSSLTYPVPPKTSIMGLLCAIIGEREYYKLNDIKYSVKIDRQISKKSFVFNGIKFALSSSMHIKEGYQDASEKKQFYRELIISPAYTIFLNLEHLEECYQSAIIKNLKEHKSVFTPYLGINFCIADFSWIDIKSCSLAQEDKSDVDTIVLLDDFIFDTQNQNIKLTTARMACACEEGRIFKDFNNFVIKVGGESRVRAKNRGNIYEINGERVYFV